MTSNNNNSNKKIYKTNIRVCTIIIKQQHINKMYRSPQIIITIITRIAIIHIQIKIFIKLNNKSSNSKIIKLTKFKNKKKANNNKISSSSSNNKVIKANNFRRKKINFQKFKNNYSKKMMN